MLFLASKTLGFFAIPSNLIVITLVAGLALMAFQVRRAGRIVLSLAVTLMLLCGFGPLGNWLIYPLEQRFPKWEEGRGAVDGIVVLGGSINPDYSAERGAPALNESAERLVAVAGLARRFPQVPILFAGGNESLFAGRPSEAEVARRIFADFGIPPERLLLEERSRTTAENAAFARTLAKPAPGSRWLLVTSAHHMPRAIGVFRAAGFAVEAYPVDWRTAGAQDLWRPFSSVARGLARTDVAAYEWIGLVAYRLSGRTAELFPGP